MKKNTTHLTTTMNEKKYHALKKSIRMVKSKRSDLEKKTNKRW